MIILSDLDDVITNFLPALFETYNTLHNDDFHCTQEIISWEIPRENFKYDLFGTLLTDGLLENMPLKPNAFDIIKKWHSQGHKIFIVTATHGSTEEFQKKTKWLINCGLDKYIEDIIPTKNKYLIRGDIFIDDNINNLREWNKYNNGTPILMNASHNRFVDSEFTRVSNWKELDKIVKGLLILDK